MPDVKRVTSPDTVISVATNGQNRKLLLPSVVRLIQIYLLAPMSAASAERSFSVQRQIKNYLRNTMFEKRYNNLLVLDIHKERTDNIDMVKLAREFVQENDRRLRFLRNSNFPANSFESPSTEARKTFEQFILIIDISSLSFLLQCTVFIHSTLTNDKY